MFWSLTYNETEKEAKRKPQNEVSSNNKTNIPSEGLNHIHFYPHHLLRKEEQPKEICIITSLEHFIWFSTH